MKTRDLAYLGIIAVLLLLDHFVRWPAFLRRSQSDPRRARIFLWSGVLALLWILAGGAIVLWVVEGRAWEALRLVVPRGWRLWGSIGLVVAGALILGRPVVKIARRTRRKRIKVANANTERLSPHDRTELMWWLAVSLSAGFCEELVFRGYLIWAFQPKLGLWGAAALSVVLFAVAHAYHGAKGVLAVGAVGSVLTAIVLLFGSLWPAMVLHALADIEQGLVAWLVFRNAPGQGVPGLPEAAH